MARAFVKQSGCFAVAGLVVLGMAACGSSGNKRASTSSTSRTSTTSTTAGGASSTVKTDCDLLTAAELQTALGVALQNGAEQSGFECSYNLAQGAGGVDVTFQPATTSVDPNNGTRRYRTDALNGQPVDVAGASEAKYDSTTNPLGQVSEEIAVLTRHGDSFTITVRGDDAPKNVQAQLVTAANAAVKRLNSG